jgi:XTP/dITP diphosphohydrolase
MKLWIATTNQGKLNEFRNIMTSMGHEIHSVSEIKNYSAPPENGATFVDNARIKAKSLKALKPGEWVIADDSGLEVEGLNNLPGVHSARYAGRKASDGENVAKLLKMMQIRSAQNRKALFVAVMVVYNPQGEEMVFEGVVEGEISEKVRGTAGFGYDPVFIPKGETQTFAELGPAVKNKLSHRAIAIRKIAEVLK